MAKSEVHDGDRTMVVKAVELKNELQKLLKAIVDEDDVNLEAVDRAQQMLLVFKELKLQKRLDLKLRHQDTLPATVPEEFKCPLSRKLMKDPVILASGQTYDRPYIQKWLKSGKRTCPETKQVLSHTTLTPNHLIRNMIMNWCKNHGITLPDCKYSDEDAWAEADKDQFVSLLKKMSATLPEQKEAAKELRRLTKQTPSFRALFTESADDAITQLVAPLSQNNSGVDTHPDLQEDIITTVLNISIHDNNKKRVAETPTVIPILVNAVRSGTIRIRSNAAAALFTLSALDSNKDLIGKSGALKALIDLLDEGHLSAMKDAASAIFIICAVHENKVIAVRDGVIGVIMKKINDRMQVDELLSILAMLSTNQKAMEQMIELGAVTSLLGIIRESSCARNKENCVSILYALCYSDQRTWKEMKEEENKHHTISQVAQNGTSRAMRKARGILDRVNRTVNITHTA